MEIEYLSDHLAFADTVAHWIYDEFIKDIRNDLTYENVLPAIQNCSKTEFPIRLIAVVDGTCAGTVSIVRNDLKRSEYSPWLASLYVDKPYRNHKVGRRLIDAVKDVVKGLGYQEVFLRTEHAGGYYQKLGWQFMESRDDYFNLKPDVFKFTLA